MTQGYVSYYLLNDSHQAATFFMMAASRPQSPQYVQSLVKKLLKQDKLNADDIESSIQLLDKYGGSSTFKEILESIQDISKNSPSKAE
jgi:hypothetical protein